MAITDIVVSGKLFQDDGDPVQGATVELFHTGTTTNPEATYSGGTTAAGLWSFTETDLDVTYDVRITSGGSTRFILWSDEIALKGVDTASLKVRGVDGAAAPIYLIADQADQDIDVWRINAADGGVLTFDSRASGSSDSDLVAQMTITPHATVASSSVTFPGILDVNGTADFDVTDFDIASSGDIDLVSTSNAASAILLHANGGTSETIKIHADQGTSVTEGAESINILSDVGGVGIRSTANLAKAINITSDGGTTGSISIFNDQGTSVTEGAESISLLSDAGGVGIRSTANLANAVNLTVDGGTSSTMTLFNDQGTAATEGSASIQLLSDVGGINVKSGLNGANAILLTADGGTSETIVLHADQGTGTGSIELLSDDGGIELDAGTDIILDAGGADIFLKDDGTLFGTLNNNSGELLIKSGSSGTTAATFSGANVTFAGTIAAATGSTIGNLTLANGSITDSGGALDFGNETLTTTGVITGGGFTIGSAAILEAELEILDGATVTTAELNLIDGNTTRGTTAVASGDGILINDSGTMRMTNVDTVSTYFASHSVGGGNIVTTGALDSGSITSNFGTIDTGSSTITTTGLISGGSLDIDNVLINGTTIGHTDDTDLITVANGVLSLAGQVGINNTDPNASSGGADDLVIGNTSAGNSGMTILTSESNIGSIYFADQTSGEGEYAGSVEYNHVSADHTDGGIEEMAFRVSYHAVAGDPEGSGSSDKVLRIRGTFPGYGSVLINDSANATNDAGLTINQHTSDDAILTLKSSSDVNHNLTSAHVISGITTETDDYAVFGKASATGGLAILAIREDEGSTANVLTIAAIGGKAGTGKGNTTGALAEIDCYEHADNNSLADVTGNGNCFAVRARVGGSSLIRFLVDEDGELYAESTTVTGFDEYDDAQLIRALDHTKETSGLKGIIKDKWDDYVKYNEQDLVDAGVLGDTIEKGGLLNVTGLQRLHNGAIWQGYKRQMELQERVNTLETKLLALEGAR